MNLHFSEKQIRRELLTLKDINTYTWEKVVSERLDSYLFSISFDLSNLVKSLSNKNPILIMRKLR